MKISYAQRDNSQADDLDELNTQAIRVNAGSTVTQLEVSFCTVNKDRASGNETADSKI
jgi:hypothetical protein